MKKVMASLLLLVVCSVFFTGCSTPERRINQNPEVFSKLTPAEQQMIREGKVGVGFTAEMVKLALGEPDKISTRTDASGTNEIWLYASYETEGGVVLYRGFYHRYWCDPVYYPYYMNFPGRRERDYMKVTFGDGKVTAVETLK